VFSKSAVRLRQAGANYGVAALGKAGLINVERESNLSGRFHDKGMQIIAGYLRMQFAQDKRFPWPPVFALSSPTAASMATAQLDRNIRVAIGSVRYSHSTGDCGDGSISQQGDIQQSAESIRRSKVSTMSAA